MQRLVAVAWIAFHCSSLALGFGSDAGGSGSPVQPGLAWQSSLTSAAETTLDELSHFLTAIDLSQYEGALRQVGCAELDALRALQA
jgi:hypothetical protein